MHRGAERVEKRAAVARGSILSGVLTSVGRINATVRNGLEVALLGGLGAAAEASPSEVVVERPVYRLRRYFPPRPTAVRR